MIKKIAKGILEPIFNVANAAYLEKYFKEMSKEGIINFDDKLKKFQKVLVISPHQDDESIGMGGTIAKLVNSGVTVDVIYITDGRQENKKDISEIRKKEAEFALKIYGIDRNITLAFENKTLSKSIENAAEQINNAVNLSEYDGIFLTSYYECNDDHEATYEIVGKFVGKKKFKDNVELFLYDINNSIQGECLNCISLLKSSEVEKKWRAYDVFKSQKYITFSTLKIMDRKKLNIYSSSDSEKYVAAEIFSNIDAAEFLRKLEYDNGFRKKMKTATSSIRLIQNMNENKKYRELMR